MKKLLYLIIWMLPALVLMYCGYSYFKAAWIYFFDNGYERLDGFAWFVIAIIHTIVFIVFSLIALALTVIVARKRNGNQNGENVSGSL